MGAGHALARLGAWLALALVPLVPIAGLSACLDGGSARTSDASDADVSGDPDRFDPTCKGPVRTPGACRAPQIIQTPETSARHIPDAEPISYAAVPPSSGDHRPAWARWGEYAALPPQRWLHNLEHGGVALLYDPCVPAEMVDALRTFARARPDDATGPFRWVLTPYPGLPTPVAAVAWEWTWLAECVDVASLTAFVDAHYRQSPEDVPSDGSFETGWLGR